MDEIVVQSRILVALLQTGIALLRSPRWRDSPGAFCKVKSRGCRIWKCKSCCGDENTFSNIVQV